MSLILHDLTLYIRLTDSGDALLWGQQDGRDLAGEQFRNVLFAWHEPSLYGTALELKQAGELAVTVLPAEQVLPFFADPASLEVVRWEGGDAPTREWLAAAPLLYREAREGRYQPSLRSYRRGKLQWTWETDSEQARELNWESLQELAVAGRELSGLEAAFSAAVSSLYYADEAAAADLRREYPALANVPQTAEGAASYTEEEWLAALGWRPDTAPFRPALQLLEPDEEEDTWRLRLVLQEKQDVSALVPVRLTQEGDVLGAWASDWTPYIRERAPGWAARLTAALPALAAGRELFADPLSDEAAWRFLTTDSRALLSDGWTVMLPSWWEAASQRKPRLRARVAPEAGAAGRSLFGLGSLVEFDWRIAIGKSDLSEAEFAELLERKERLVRFRGEWVLLDPALLEQIRRFMAGIRPEEGLSLQDVLQLHLLREEGRRRPGTPRSAGGDEEEEDDRIQLEVELNAHLLTMLRRLSQPAELEALEQPAGLRAELRSYQREGFTWLSFLRRFGLGACLADDMGLGKTVQFIAYLLHHREEADAPALLICPTSVLGNWQKELARFAPELNVHLRYGKGRVGGEEWNAVLEEADVVLTSYTTALLDQEMLQEVSWSSLCLDEAQNIKNAQNKQSAAVRSFQARHRIALTGTPIENRLSELWSIYDFLNPGYLGTQRGFQQRFAHPIEKDRDEERTRQLQSLVKPFLLRRKKQDPAIQLDLPDKLETKVYINLTAEQGALYEQAVKKLMERMDTLEGMKRKGAILSALTELKQLCDHPVLLTEEAEEAGEALRSEAFREAFLARSAKADRLVAMVDELRNEGDSCLIFTQYVGMGRLLARLLQAHRDEPVLFLNGGTPKAERDRMIETFQRADETSPGIFVLSLKAGGVGLNLTAANHVFHFDRWWNPAVENQATDRAYRMGQKRNVQVHKFISYGTLEEKIDEMLESKLSLSENVIATSESWITEFSDDQLHELLALRQAW
ncbi:ATP-dependent helicase [Paenibacillus sp. J31TS4]|uniref:DEAD/DEAH box helicase n=1 Tax=Paenibacillus sp. J31TS4 TaxID=2807195 RepID=UPI001B2148E3|nr:DEAD/DEAH box helicase [Paenibacillus sp. J31TS4]GIP36773.1 ATP-dependent helicase [Paenibacillus sp. J31TS4]